MWESLVHRHAHRPIVEPDSCGEWQLSCRTRESLVMRAESQFATQSSPACPSPAPGQVPSVIFQGGLGERRGVRMAKAGLSRAFCRRPDSEGLSLDLDFEILSFLPSKLLDDSWREHDDPLDVILTAETTTQLLLKSHNRGQ